MPAHARSIVTGIVLATGLAAQTTVLSPYWPAATPEVVGTKTASGLRIVSRDAATPFALTLEAREINPIDPDRLLWMVDGMELELTTAMRHVLVPAPDDDAKRLEQFHASRLSAARNNGSPPPGLSESFACGSGNACLLWSEPEAAGKDTWIAATGNANVLVLLQARSVSASDRQRVRQYLMQALRTVEFGAVAAPPRESAVEQTGADLEAQLRLQSALTGVEFTPLLNSRLATPKDAKVGGAVVLDQATLTELAKYLVGTAEKEKVMLTVTVFDGALAHAINLTAYDGSARQFHYWDPWGQGSFLQRANNHAGVNAVPDPARPRIWIVAEDEFSHVLYSVIWPTSAVFAVFRMATALAGDPDKAVEMYRDLKAQPQSSNPPEDNPFSPPETSDLYLKSVQTYLEAANRLDQAVTVLRIRSALDPKASAEKPEFVRRLQEGRRTDLVQAVNRPVQESTPPAYSPIDMDLAKKTDFFRFFHLEEAGTKPAEEDGSVIDFKPSGPSFHDLVDLNVTVQNKAAQKLILAMNRSFVSGSETLPFAADFAKSFLAFALAEAKSGPIADLTKEIDTWWRSERTFVPVPGSPDSTKVPMLPSGAYMVYIGGGAMHVLPFRNGRVTLENVRQNARSRLQITVERTK